MGPPYFVGSSSEATIKARINNFDGNPLWASACLMSDPKLLIDVYRDFIKAGVDILLTNTYQASVEGFQKHLGLDEEDSIKLFKKSVTCCRQAIEIEKANGTIDKEKQILVFGMSGTFAAHLADGSEYTGEYIVKYDIKEIEAFQRRQIQIQLDSGVDGLLFPTIAAAKEAFMLTELIKEFPSIKAILSFSCSNGTNTCGGDKFDEVASKCWSLNPNQLLAVGVNCSLPVDIDNLIFPLHEKGIPTNAITLTNEEWDSDKNEWKESKNDYNLYIKKWCEMRVQYIGGGCQTNLKTIYEIGDIIKNFKSEK